MSQKSMQFKPGMLIEDVDGTLHGYRTAILIRKMRYNGSQTYWEAYSYDSGQMRKVRVNEVQLRMFVQRGSVRVHGSK